MIIVTIRFFKCSNKAFFNEKLNIVRRTSMSQLADCSIEAGHPSLGRVSPVPGPGTGTMGTLWAGHRVLVITTEIGTANCSYYLPFGRGRAVMRDRSADNITTRDIHHPWSPSWLGYGLRMKVHVPVTYLKGCWEDWRIVTWHDDGWEEESGDCGGCLWFLRVLINQRLTGDYIWRFLS